MIATWSDYTASEDTQLAGPQLRLTSFGLAVILCMTIAYLALTKRFDVIASFMEEARVASVMMLERPLPPAPAAPTREPSPPAEQRDVLDQLAPPTPTLDPASTNPTPGSFAAGAISGASGSHSTPAGGGALVWAALPTDRLMRRLYPQAARIADLEGRVVLNCEIQTDLSAMCAVQSESPRGYGFGAAALRASQALSAQMLRSDGTPSAGSRAEVVVNFRRDVLTGRQR